MFQSKVSLSFFTLELEEKFLPLRGKESFVSQLLISVLTDSKGFMESYSMFALIQCEQIFSSPACPQKENHVPEHCERHGANDGRKGGHRLRFQQPHQEGNCHVCRWFRQKHSCWDVKKKKGIKKFFPWEACETAGPWKSLVSLAERLLPCDWLTGSFLQGHDDDRLRLVSHHQTLGGTEQGEWEGSLQVNTKKYTKLLSSKRV